MPIAIDPVFKETEVGRLKARKLAKAVTRTAKKAGSTATRDMTAEAGKRVRARKKLKLKDVKTALVPRRPVGTKLDQLVFELAVKGDPVPLSKYPARQTRRGVTVEVNRGKRTLIESAFLASMPSGHKGVFVRIGRERLPIDELLGSRPVDALLHAGETEKVAKRGQDSFSKTFERLLSRELSKA